MPPGAGHQQSRGEACDAADSVSLLAVMGGRVWCVCEAVQEAWSDGTPIPPAPWREPLVLWPASAAAAKDVHMKGIITLEDVIEKLIQAFMDILGNYS